MRNTYAFCKMLYIIRKSCKKEIISPYWISSWSNEQNCSAHGAFVTYIITHEYFEKAYDLIIHITKNQNQWI
jgi:hypothetical protein